VYPINSSVDTEKKYAFSVPNLRDAELLTTTSEDMKKSIFGVMPHFHQGTMTALHLCFISSNLRLLRSLTLLNRSPDAFFMSSIFS